MTLATQIRIIGDVSPEGVFAKAREIIGIPAGQPFRIGNYDFDGDGWMRTASEPGGFRSALDMLVAIGGNADLRYHGEYCGPDCTCEQGGTPPCNIIVRLDTAYGYEGPEGGCSDVHREVCARLGAWLDALRADWWAQDEYYGDWHRRTPCPLTDETRKAVQR